MVRNRTIAGRQRDRRVRAIERLLRFGHSLAAVAKRLKVSRQTAWRWRNWKKTTYDLVVKPGRKPTFTEEHAREADRIAKRMPCDFGLRGEYWSVAKFAEYFARNQPQAVGRWNRSQMHRLLKRAGVKWKSKSSPNLRNQAVKSKRKTR